MTWLDRNIPRFLPELGARMALTGALTAAILRRLAAPVPPEPPAQGTGVGDLRNGAGIVVAVVVGLRTSRRMELRWGGE